MRRVLRHAPIFRLICAFARTRLLARRLKTRLDVEAWQQRRISRRLRGAVGSTDFYRRHNAAKLSSLPIVDKALVMAAFEQFNTAGLSSAEAWQMFESGRQRKGDMSLVPVPAPAAIVDYSLSPTPSDTNGWA